MAPGGKGDVDCMVRGLDAVGRQAPDVGCGIGGPALAPPGDHGAIVTGADLEAPPVACAHEAARGKGLEDRRVFRVVAPGPMPFPDAGFEVVFGSGSFTRIEATGAAPGEIMRTLRPGGWLIFCDWPKAPGDHSDAIREWFRLEGLTCAMRTLEAYAALLGDAGFADVSVGDRSDWYRGVVREAYDRLRGEFCPAMVERPGGRRGRWAASSRPGAPRRGL